MNRIDDFFERIKGQQPCLEDVDSVTDAIMARIEAQPVVEQKDGTRRLLLHALFQAGFSAAAVVVFGLFVVNSGVEPIENSVVMSTKDSRVLSLAGIEKCRSAADFCTFYNEHTRPRRNAGQNISTLKNLYYASKK